MTKLLLFPMLLIGMLFVAIVISMYKSESEKNKKLKKELETELSKKVKRELVSVPLSFSDKKQLMRLFKEKISFMSFISETKDYLFYYKKGETTIAGINKDYAIIKVKVRKLKLRKESFFNVTITAWKTENDFKENKTPDKELVDLLCKKEIFNSQMLAGLNKFFNNPTNTNTLKIETD